MTNAVPMVDILRGGLHESRHLGHAVIVNEKGDLAEGWGDPNKIILPRSSCKMLQALPLLESGAGENLTREQLALTCASHSGETRHVTRVSAWLGELGLDESALRCGPQSSRDPELRMQMIRNEEPVTRIHNNCSGKHAGFLTLTKHLNASADYVEMDHPVQVAVKSATEETCGEDISGFGIDGCSAPNFATSLLGLGRAMARFASAEEGKDARNSAMVRLRNAMMAHPELVAGQGRACTDLMNAAKGRAAVKTGAEGVFIAILPDLKLGIAIKIEDGATRAAEIAIASLLARLGIIDKTHPMLNREIRNWDGLLTGHERPAFGFADATA